LRIYTINEPTGKILLESIRKNNKFDDADRLQLLITLDALNDNNELVASEIFSSDTHIVYSPICCSDYPYVECRYIYGIAYSNVGIGASAFNKNIYIFPEFSANMGSNKQDDLLNIAFGIVQNGGRYIFNRVHFIAPITSSGSDLDKVSKLEGNFYFKGYGQYAY
jgi:hypothetical protein